jgi:hypothetical protein
MPETSESLADQTTILTGEKRRRYLDRDMKLYSEIEDLMCDPDIRRGITRQLQAAADAGVVPDTDSVLGFAKQIFEDHANIAKELGIAQKEPG